MPLYEYQCRACGKVTERVWSYQRVEANLVSFTIPCEHCTDGMATKKRSAPTLKFTGSGFHATDYDKHGPKT